MENMGKAINARFANTVKAVEKLRARGGKIVFVRFPLTGGLKELEDKATPRAGIWDRVLRETGVPGIYFEDYPELASFDCPEWSHLSAPDSVEFTKRLVPHLRTALGMRHRRCGQHLVQFGQALALKLAIAVPQSLVFCMLNRNTQCRLKCVSLAGSLNGLHSRLYG